MVMLGETGDHKPGLSRPVALHVFVDDVDATFARAIAAGGTAIGGASVGDPADRPYGSPGLGSRYQDQHLPTASRSWLQE